MPTKLPLSAPVSITAVPLTPSSFAPFGYVIQNPSPHLTPSPSLRPSDLPLSAFPANQGSAIKYANISRPLNLYAQAPSQKPGTEITSLFTCAARALESPPVVPAPISTLLPYSYSSANGGRFVVEILERHPFTTQTFIPLGSPQATYLVVVAPSLPPSEGDKHLPVPPAEGGTLPGRGLPDVQRLQAFIATADQAVTYGAGTWHSPMVALGQKGSAVDFVVCQAANGVAVEDCQEVVLESKGLEKPQIVVKVPERLRLTRL